MTPSIARDGIEPSLPPYQDEVLPLHHRAVCVAFPALNSRLSTLDSSDPCGIRTQPLQLERLATSPEVQRARKSQWAGRRSNPSLLVFSQALNRLSYQPEIVPSFVVRGDQSVLTTRSVRKALSSSRTALDGLEVRRTESVPCAICNSNSLADAAGCVASLRATKKPGVFA